MLLILETFEDEVSLLILKLLNAVICSHIVELPDLIALYKLLVTVIQLVVLLLSLRARSIRMEHVGAEVQNRALVDVTVLVIELLCTLFGAWHPLDVPVFHIFLIQRLLTEHFNKAADLVAEVDCRGLDHTSERLCLVQVAQGYQNVDQGRCRDLGLHH